MAFSVKILADSVNPAGNRLTTMELTYPRFIHSEMLTHRAFSRNSASSRAIPVEKMIQRVMEDPVIPIRWGAKQKGMVAGTALNDHQVWECEYLWLMMRDQAVQTAQEMVDLGLHKTIPNRLLEPWTWITVIVSATEWDNFFTLRTAPDAEDHMRHLAIMMKEAYDGHEPELLEPEHWHLPLISLGDELDSSIHPSDYVKLSVARCARVSYLTHDGRRDPYEDLRLYHQLLESRHLSPFEHAAEAQYHPHRIANFVGWKQHRTYIEENEF